MSAVRCIYGSNIQEIAEMLDRKWCDEHCEKRRNRNEKYTVNVECFHHLMEMGIDPYKKENSV